MTDTPKLPPPTTQDDESPTTPLGWDPANPETDYDGHEAELPVEFAKQLAGEGGE